MYLPLALAVLFACTVAAYPDPDPAQVRYGTESPPRKLTPCESDKASVPEATIPIPVTECLNKHLGTKESDRTLLLLQELNLNSLQETTAIQKRIYSTMVRPAEPVSDPQTLEQQWSVLSEKAYEEVAWLRLLNEQTTTSLIKLQTTIANDLATAQPINDTARNNAEAKLRNQARDVAEYLAKSAEYGFGEPSDAEQRAIKKIFEDEAERNKPLFPWLSACGDWISDTTLVTEYIQPANRFLASKTQWLLDREWRMYDIGALWVVTLLICGFCSSSNAAADPVTPVTNTPAQPTTSQ